MMLFSLNKPCEDCPFLKIGGVRVTPERAKGLAEAALSTQGTTFTCHKTQRSRTEQHCAGALIFSEKHGVATQMMRIAERLRPYDPVRIHASPDTNKVFDSMDEMVVAQKEIE